MSHLLSITDPYYDLGKGTAGSESEGFTHRAASQEVNTTVVATSQDRLFSSLCVRAVPHLDQVNHPPSQYSPNPGRQENKEVFGFEPTTTGCRN